MFQNVKKSVIFKINIKVKIILQCSQKSALQIFVFAKKSCIVLLMASPKMVLLLIINGALFLYPTFMGKTKNHNLKDLFLRSDFFSCIVFLWQSMSIELRLYWYLKWKNKKKLFFDLSNAIWCFTVQNHTIVMLTFFVENLILFRMIPMSFILWYDDFLRKNGKNLFFDLSNLIYIKLEHKRKSQR